MKKSAKVFITSAYQDPSPISEFIRFASLDKIKNHQVVDKPDTADVILFIESSRYHHDSRFTKLKNHPLVKQYPNKVFMYNPHDLPWYILPGMYTCMPKQINNDAYIASSPYLETINQYITYDSIQEPNYLFSFYGALTSPVRKEIIELTHPRAYIAESTRHIMYGQDKPQQMQQEYAALLSNSKFILCPKGTGTSSIRLFEALKAGRVPVILSDDWVRPPGIDWEKIAVFIPENHTSKIIEILEAEESRWPYKSKLARQTWEDFFAPQTIFNYFIDCILNLTKDKESSLSVKIREQLRFMDWYIRKQLRSYLQSPLASVSSLLKRPKL